MYVCSHTTRECTRFVDYVKELTKNPSDVNKKSRDELSKNGFSDRDIWDISLITGFFNMTNRLAIATEMEPNDIYHSSHR